jgi:hypothetical protein
MAEVVLLYARDCPNVGAARKHLLEAFVAAGLPPAWREVDLDAEDTPEAWRRLGSPSVLIDGEDVTGGASADGATCRLYDGGARAPSPTVIAERLRRAVGAPPLGSRDALRAKAPVVPAGGGSLSVAAIPAVVVALLPKAMCPACWPAYAAVLSSLGLGFLMEDRYLLPITIAMLTLAVAAMLYRARSRRGAGPAIAAAASGVALVVGKYVLELSDAFAYAMVGVFVAAAIWNAWPVRRNASCPACVAREPAAR